MLISRCRDLGGRDVHAGAVAVVCTKWHGKTGVMRDIPTASVQQGKLGFGPRDHSGPDLQSWFK